MYKYRAVFSNNQNVDFKSSLHIKELNVNLVNGASMIYFYDAEVALNLIQVKELWIDGTKYQLRAYTV